MCDLLRGNLTQQPPGVDAPHSWGPCEADTFNVRTGPNYKKNQKKAASLESLYETVSVSAFRTDKKQLHISELLEAPPDDPLREQLGIPTYIIAHMMIPSYAPALVFGGGDGEGWSVVFTAKLRDKVKEELLRGTPSNAARLIKAFLLSGPASPLRKRVKCIARVGNFEECGFSSTVSRLVSQYNAKPFVARTTSSFYPEKTYFEIDLDIHNFGRPARIGLHGCKEVSKKMIFDWAFVIEGVEDDELPEQIMMCTRLNKLDPEKAPHLDQVLHPPAPPATPTTGATTTTISDSHPPNSLAATSSTNAMSHLADSSSSYKLNHSFAEDKSDSDCSSSSSSDEATRTPGSPESGTFTVQSAKRSAPPRLIAPGSTHSSPTVDLSDIHAPTVQAPGTQHQGPRSSSLSGRSLNGFLPPSAQGVSRTSYLDSPDGSTAGRSAITIEGAPVEGSILMVIVDMDRYPNYNVQWFRNRESFSTKDAGLVYIPTRDDVGKKLGVALIPAEARLEDCRPVWESDVIEPSPPFVSNLKLHNCFCGSDAWIEYEYFGGYEGNTQSRWYVSRTGHEWTLRQSCDDKNMYHITADDINCHVKCCVTPGRNDGALGEPKEVAQFCPLTEEMREFLLQSTLNGSMQFDVGIIADQTSNSNGVDNSQLVFNHKYIWLTTDRPGQSQIVKAKWKKSCHIEYQANNKELALTCIPNHHERERIYRFRVTESRDRTKLILAFRLYHALAMEGIAPEVLGPDVASDWKKGKFELHQIDQKTKKKPSKRRPNCFHRLSLAMARDPPPQMCHVKWKGPYNEPLSDEFYNKWKQDTHQYQAGWIAARETLLAMMGSRTPDTCATKKQAPYAVPQSPKGCYVETPITTSTRTKKDFIGVEDKKQSFSGNPLQHKLHQTEMQQQMLQLKGKLNDMQVKYDHLSAETQNTTRNVPRLNNLQQQLRVTNNSQIPGLSHDIMQLQQTVHILREELVILRLLVGAFLVMAVCVYWAGRLNFFGHSQ